SQQVCGPSDPVHQWMGWTARRLAAAVPSNAATHFLRRLGEIVTRYRRSRDLVLLGDFLNFFDVFGRSLQLGGVDLRYQLSGFGLEHPHHAFGRINVDDRVDRSPKIKMHKSSHKFSLSFSQAEI